jgi:hypothetical protein
MLAALSATMHRTSLAVAKKICFLALWQGLWLCVHPETSLFVELPFLTQNSLLQNVR